MPDGEVLVEEVDTEDGRDDEDHNTRGENGIASAADGRGPKMSTRSCKLGDQ